jgi:hypothetical protein
VQAWHALVLVGQQQPAPRRLVPLIRYCPLPSRFRSCRGRTLRHAFSCLVCIVSTSQCHSGSNAPSSTKPVWLLVLRPITAASCPTRRQWPWNPTSLWSGITC